MCLICVDVIKGNLTTKEIANNFREMSEEDGHWIEVVELLQSKGLVEEVGTELSKSRGSV